MMHQKRTQFTFLRFTKYALDSSSNGQDEQINPEKNHSETFGVFLKGKNENIGVYYEQKPIVSDRHKENCSIRIMKIHW